MITEKQVPEDKNSLPPLVYAEASIHSTGGMSLFETTEPITPENVTQFHNKPEFVDTTVKKLKQAGFDVLQVGPTSVNIAAPVETYEKVFQTKIVPVEHQVDSARPCNGIWDRRCGTSFTNSPRESTALIC